MSDLLKRVGRRDALPNFDVFGGLRRAGWNMRGVGDGRVVAIPPMADEARVQAAIADIMAALTPPKRKRKSQGEPVDEHET